MTVGDLKAGTDHAAGREGTALLRLALRLDAAASGGLGVLLVAAGSGIDQVLGIPAAVLMSLGVVLIGYGSLLWTVASLPTVPIPGAWTVVVGNLVWVAASITAVAADWWTATGAGTAVILAQAVAVAGFAGLQILGLRTERGGTP